MPNISSTGRIRGTTSSISPISARWRRRLPAISTRSQAGAAGPQAPATRERGLVGDLLFHRVLSSSARQRVVSHAYRAARIGVLVKAVRPMRANKALVGNVMARPGQCALEHRALTAEHSDPVLADLLKGWLGVRAHRFVRALERVADHRAAGTVETRQALRQLRVQIPDRAVGRWQTRTARRAGSVGGTLAARRASWLVVVAISSPRVCGRSGRRSRYAGRRSAGDCPRLTIAVLHHAGSRCPLICFWVKLRVAR